MDKVGFVNDMSMTLIYLFKNERATDYFFKVYIVFPLLSKSFTPHYYKIGFVKF